MKKMYSAIFALLAGIALHSQCSIIIANHTNVTCFGACNGTVSVQSIGTPNYTYSWSPGGQTIQNPTNLCPGVNVVTMTDANSCQATASVTITEPPVLTSVITHTAVTCNGACNGSATETASGGTAPYTYLWNDTSHSITASINNLCPRIYAVTVTDLNGCTKADSVLITEPALLVVTATAVDASCSTCADGSASASTTGGTGLYSYLWSPGGATTSSVSNLTPGSYTVCVTDANNCSDCDTIMVNSPNSVANLDGKYGIGLYPNPVTDKVNLVITSPEIANMHVDILDVTGKIIYEEEFYGMKGVVKEYNFMNYEPGIYFMEIKIGDSRITKKIIKE
jgi:hypothetical protein